MTPTTVERDEREAPLTGWFDPSSGDGPFELEEVVRWQAWEYWATDDRTGKRIRLRDRRMAPSQP